MLRPVLIASAAALCGCQQTPVPPAADAADILHAVEHAQSQVDRGDREDAGKAGAELGVGR
jgi:hypothetical protein